MPCSLRLLAADAAAQRHLPPGWIDLASKMVVGWQLGNRATAQLCVETLEMERLFSGRYDAGAALVTVWLLRMRLRAQARRRLLTIKRRMPFLLDLLTLLMEAGATFLQALDDAVCIILDTIAGRWNRLTGVPGSYLTVTIDGEGASQLIHTLQAQLAAMTPRHWALTDTAIVEVPQ